MNDLPTFSLEGRTVIVTGASSGLGERFSRVAHAAGANVVVAARRVERLESLSGDLGGDRVLTVGCDVAVNAHCEALVAATVDRFGEIDVLVNNAGIAAPARAEDEAPEQWRRVIDVNLTALFILTQLVGRRMLTRGSGSIVNIASILGLVASAPINQASYVASKGAVVNLTKELACQWARRGVRVNAIAPGWFPSELTANDLFGDESAMAYLRRNCPMARGGEVNELDGALLFLATDASTYVTGTTITVDGGWTAR